MALFHANLAKFDAAAEMDARLRSRISAWELFALAFAFCSLGIFLWAHGQLNIVPFDYNNYLNTAEGNFLQFYYAEWVLPVFWLWSRIPYWWGYSLWGILNILCLFFAARIFGGSSILALLSFQMFYVLFLGQIVGILVGGLALG